jgi:hypothetical protein
MNSRRNIFLKQYIGFLCIVLFWISFYPAAQGAQTLVMAWNASKDKNVVGYCVYYGIESSNYTARIVLPKKKTKVAVSGLNEGVTYYFTVTSYDSQGLESAPSKEIPYIVPGILALSQRLNSSDPARIKFPVVPKHRYEVQASDDLRSWVTIGQVKGVSNEWMEFDDSTAPSHQQRFYRLVLR